MTFRWTMGSMFAPWVGNADVRIREGESCGAFCVGPGNAHTHSQLRQIFSAVVRGKRARRSCQ